MRKLLAYFLFILLLLSGCNGENGVYYRQIPENEIRYKYNGGLMAYSKLHHDGRIYTSSETYTQAQQEECPLEPYLGDEIIPAWGNHRAYWSTDREELFEVTQEAVLYEVNGYDPSFLICLYYEVENPDIETRYGWIIFKCLNGITLGKGSELFSDRFHLSQSVQAVGVHNETQTEYEISMEDTALKDFLSALNGGTFLSPEDENCPSFDETEGVTLSFCDSVGITANVTVYESGYAATRLFGQQIMTLTVDIEACQAIIAYVEDLQI